MKRFDKQAMPVWAAVSMIVAAAAAGGVNAQDQDGFQGLEEVVVTARKTAEQLINVPLAITAFTAESIEARGIANLDDVAAYTPGLTFSNVLGEFLPAPVIRGVAPVAITGELNTAIFFDGVFVSGREGINFSQLDLERIEVVKGPQAALYGRNAFSGAINYVSAKPTDEFKGKVVGTIGNDGKLLGQLTVSGPIGDQGLKGRLTVLQDGWDGSYKNAFSGAGNKVNIGGYDYKTLNGTLLWDPIDTFSAELGLYVSDDRIDTPPVSTVAANCEDQRVGQQIRGIPLTTSRLLNYCGELPVVAENSLIAVPGATGEDRHIVRSHLKLSWDVAGGTLDSVTGFSKVRQSFRVDGSRGAGTLPLTYQTTTNTRAVLNTGFVQVGGNDVTEEISQELRFSSDRNKPLRYSFGGYYYETEQTSGIDGVVATSPLPANFRAFCGPASCIFIPPATLLNPTGFVGDLSFKPWFTDPLGGATFGEILVDNASAPQVFGALEYDFTKAITGSVDARYTEEKRSYIDNRTNAGAEDTWELLSWRASLRYKPADNITWFAAAAHSEKSGDFDPTAVTLATGATTTLPGAFDSEKLNSFEVGLKAELLDRRVSLGIDLYYLDWSDIVIPQVVTELDGVALALPVAVDVNGGDARIKGIEFTMVARPMRGLDLNLGMTYSEPEYTDAKIESFLNFPTYAPTGDVSGNQILRTSKFQGNAGFQITRGVGSGDRDFFLRADVAHRGKQYADASNQTIIPESTNLNASLGLRAEDWSVELWGRNLTNEDVPTGAFRDVYFTNTTPAGLHNGGTYFPWRYTVSHPRRTTYGLTFRYNF